MAELLAMATSDCFVERQFVCRFAKPVGDDRLSIRALLKGDLWMKGGTAEYEIAISTPWRAFYIATITVGQRTFRFDGERTTVEK